ncbi:uncharacterized protein LOC131308424 [Rhododendron vialii]|uniref:uncharacterized protein LOC131308424 n=1 Tax=Rhododendron vialii TaxID=182163 RepID=UPI00265FD97A|nr:uncharacterized protein LOC131308424 [Rhododendron vialii]
MGNHKSVATAKLIFLDGAIQVYSSPVKVSQILDQNPACFICHSDHMEFDEFVSAVDVDDELQMGHLYFALPVSWLAQPLQGEDMAALAVKASLAFPNSRDGRGGEIKCGCCFSRPRVDDDQQDRLMFSGEKYVSTSRRKVVAVGGEGGELVQEISGRGHPSGHGRKLSMIPEDQGSFGTSSSLDHGSFGTSSSLDPGSFGTSSLDQGSFGTPSL